MINLSHPLDGLQLWNGWSTCHVITDIYHVGDEKYGFKNQQIIHIYHIALQYSVLNKNKNHIFYIICQCEANLF